MVNLLIPIAGQKSLKKAITTYYSFLAGHQAQAKTCLHPPDIKRGEGQRMIIMAYNRTKCVCCVHFLWWFCNDSVMDDSVKYANFTVFTKLRSARIHQGTIFTNFLYLWLKNIWKFFLHLHMLFKILAFRKICEHFRQETYDNQSKVMKCVFCTAIVIIPMICRVRQQQCVNARSIFQRFDLIKLAIDGHNWHEDCVREAHHQVWWQSSTQQSELSVYNPGHCTSL